MCVHRHAGLDFASTDNRQLFRIYLRRLSNHVLFFSLVDNVVNPLLCLRAMIPILMVTAEDEDTNDETGSDPTTIIALYSDPPLTRSRSSSINSRYRVEKGGSNLNRLKVFLARYGVAGTGTKGSGFQRRQAGRLPYMSSGEDVKLVRMPFCSALRRI